MSLYNMSPLPLPLPGAEAVAVADDETDFYVSWNLFFLPGFILVPIKLNLVC